MRMDHQALAAEIKSSALCRTEHPADAIAVLMMAAGDLLQAQFGIAQGMALLRASIDDVEAAMNNAADRAAGQ